jgi:curli biogenesis system outer membrane secretion channel CsgG
MKIHTVLIALVACVLHSGVSVAAKKSSPEVITHPTANCQGPKKRLAVLRFGGTGKYGAYEGWDVGDALAAQLSTALDQTHCFVIADRLALSDVLREQELGLAGVANRETAARAGALIGAQILVKGEITEFEPGKQGRGVTAGIGLGNIPLGLRVGGNRNIAHIAADIRLIDATTGEVLFTQRVDSQAKTFGIALGLDYKQASIASENFDKTPLGMAVRDAVVEAAGYIVKQTYEIEWTGQVVQADAGEIFVNAGTESGVKVGDAFILSTIERELIDPGTGASLGRVERPLGEVRVEQVNGKYAIAKPVGEFPVRRGDLVRSTQKKS